MKSQLRGIPRPDPCGTSIFPSLIMVIFCKAVEIEIDIERW
jgi:hypothetical protein